MKLPTPCRRWRPIWGRILWGLAPALLPIWTAGANAQPAPVAAPDANAALEEPEIGSQWVRLLEDKQGEPRAMQTAIVRYVPRGEVASGRAADDYRRYVDLVGAVHIGDRNYYRTLNRRFKAYDAVLYELVAAKGTVVPRGRGTSNAHPLGALQNGMKSMLQVEHQLEQIDYTSDNFIHADLSPEEFAQTMERRDEGFLKMFAKMMGASMAQQSQQAARGESADIDFMAALFAKDRPRQMKIAMAKQFESMEALMVSLNGPDGSTLITERNIRALDVLAEQLAAGDDRLAIFYGAGHLSDMHDRMLTRFKMVPVSIEWLDAWDLR